MLQPSELRIGNWVKFRGNPGQVYHLLRLESESRSEIYITEAGIDQNSSIEDLEPIPLTVEIAEQCGFFQLKPYQVWSSNELQVQGMSLKDEIFEYGRGSKILFVHQLQNLYFALTGKELEIKF
jgi:hypothetical protein